MEFLRIAEAKKMEFLRTAALVTAVILVLSALGMVFYEQTSPLERRVDLVETVVGTKKGSVGTDIIQDTAVTTAKLADTSVTTTKLAESAVTSVKITDETIVAADIATGAVTSAKILDGTIETVDIKDGAVTSAKIADGVIVNVDIADNTIENKKLKDDTITTDKIRDLTIATIDISDSAITTAKIAENAVTVAKLAPDQKGKAATRVVAADGSGDFTSIQAAIDNLPAGGGMVYIKEGTYTITSSIRVPSKVALVGSGNATVIKVGADVDAITNKNPAGGDNDILIADIRIDGDRLSRTAGASGIYFENVRHSRIRNLWIADANGCGINFANCDNNIITDTICDANRDEGIILQVGSDSNIITNNLSYDSKTKDGIALHYSHYNLIAKNRCVGNAHSGIYLEDSDYNTVEGNILEKDNWDGIQIRYDSDNNLLSANHCVANLGYGIRIWDPEGEYNKLTANFYSNNKDGTIADGGTNTQRIVTEDISDGAVTTVKLADGAVTSRKAKLTVENAFNETAESTTGTTWVDLTGSSVSVTVETPSWLLIDFCANANVNGADNKLEFQILVGTTPVNSATLVMAKADQNLTVSLMRAYKVGAGTYTVKAQWRIEIGTGTGWCWRKSLSVLVVSQ